MNEEELYKLALSDVPTYSLLNEILAIRDKRFSNEEVDYCVNVNGYISLDVLNKYVKMVQENQQLKEELKYSVSIVEHNKCITNIVKKKRELKSVLDEIREYIKEHNDYLEKAKEIYIGYEDELLKSTCIQLINNELVRSDNLLQILDKVGSNE